MKPLLILAPALLMALPAVAQDAPTAPADGYQALWCHIAFETMTTMIPPLPADLLEAAHNAGADATPEQQELLAAEAEIARIASGGPLLLDTAKLSYTGAGFTDAQFDEAKTGLTPQVNEGISGAADEAEFSYESCLSLLPAPTPETPAAQ